MLYPAYSLELFLDLYELTMVQGFFKKGKDTQAVFDAFIRKAPHSQPESYVLFAGLAPLLQGIKDFRFKAESIAYLKGLNLFEEDFLEFLSNFQFKGSFWTAKEGDIVFPNAPFLRAEGTLIELQLMEGLILNVLNFQSLIATKASRIVWGAGAGNLLEFGLRRAQGIDGALSASRASVIGGAVATSNTLAGQVFDIPVRGTMAHSWVMSFEHEREAFQNYADLYPNACVLLIDTYNTLESGIRNAIPVLKSLQAKGLSGFGVRIDSGDLAYLSTQVRTKLDEAGLTEAKIAVSNDLDEHIISQLMANNAPIDLWGVGTQLVTGGEFSALSGVFKLSALKYDESSPWQDKMKLTDNISKTSQPGIKNVFRFYSADGKMMGDLICLESEIEELQAQIKQREAISAHHPFGAQSSWKISDYASARLLLELSMESGISSLKTESLMEIQARSRASFESLDPRYYRLLNPHLYKVGLSSELLKRKEAGLQAYQADYP